MTIRRWSRQLKGLLPAPSLSVNPSDLVPFVTTNALRGADGHWLLGGSAASLTDLTEGLALSPLDGAHLPTYSGGYLQVASGGYYGLTTPFHDAADQTVLGVFQRRLGNAEGSQNSWLFGAYNTAGTMGDGVFVITLNSYFWVAAGEGTSAAFTMPGTDGDWLFMALTNQTGIGRTLLIGDGSGNLTRLFVAGTKTPNAANFINLGSAYFQSSGYVRGPKCSEFAVYKQPRTDAQVLSIYNTIKARGSGADLSIVVK